MLLTFVQLHILLVAAPAFANWVLLCPATLGNTPAAPAQVVYLVCRNVLEAAVPTTVERHGVTMRQSQPRLAARQPLAVGVKNGSLDGLSFFAVPNNALFQSFVTFPHAARAP